jgi:lipopolysaccharide exporter
MTDTNQQAAVSRRNDSTPSAPPRAPSARRIVGQLKWVGVGHVLSQVAWYSMVLVLAAMLPPTAFGTVAIGVTLVGVATLLASAGTGGSIIAATHLTEGQLRSAVRLNLAIGIVISGGIAALAAPVVTTLAHGGDVLAVRALSVSVLLAAVAVVPVAILQKELEFKRFAVVNAAAASLTAVAAIIAAALGAGVWALVIRQVVYQGFVAAFAWIAVWPLLSAIKSQPSTQNAEIGRPVRAADQDRLAFLALSASYLLGFTVDNAVVGGATNATQLGFYALAFTLGFAPMTQFGSQLVQVLFPAAAATSDLATVGRRTLKAARLVALMLLPLVAPAIVLAPVLIPTLFGNEWRPIVTPFQLFICLGVAHSVINTVNGALAGTGNMPRLAVVDLLWALSTLAAIFVLVRVDGIQGAAIARFLVFAPLAWWYLIRGTGLLGVTTHETWIALRGVVLPVAVQAVVTATLFFALVDLGAARDVSAAAAGAVGVACAVGLLWAVPSRPLREVRGVLGLLGRGGERWTTETGTSEGPRLDPPDRRGQGGSGAHPPDPPQAATP